MGCTLAISLLVAGSLESAAVLLPSADTRDLILLPICNCVYSGSQCCTIYIDENSKTMSLPPNAGPISSSESVRSICKI